MKITKLLMALLLGMAVTATALYAEVYSDDDAGVSINIPSSWEVSFDDGDLQAEKGEIMFILTSGIDTEDLEGFESGQAFINFVKGQLEEQDFSNIRFGRPHKGSVNGMASWDVTGTASIEGSTIHLGVSIIETDEEDGTAIMAFRMSTSVGGLNQATALINGIKPLN